MEVAIVKSEKREIDIVVDELLQLFLSAVSEKYVWQTRLFHYLALAILKLHGALCRAIGFYAFCRKVIVGFAFPAVGGAESIPVG